MGEQVLLSCSHVFHKQCITSFERYERMCSSQQGSLLYVRWVHCAAKKASAESAMAGLQNRDAAHCAAQKHIKSVRSMMVERLIGTDVQPGSKQLCAAIWLERGTGNSGADSPLKTHV